MMKPGILLGSAILFLAGCGDSSTPLSDPSASNPDMRLIGLWWVGGEEDQGAYYNISPAHGNLPAAMMRVTITTHSKGNLQPPSDAFLFPTSLDGKTYLNMTTRGGEQVRLMEEKSWQAIDSYSIFKYKLDGDTLLVWFMDGDAKKRVIAAGAINGVVEKQGRFGVTVKFTDTMENLVRFVTQEGDDLFVKEPVRLQRVK